MRNFTKLVMTDISKLGEFGLINHLTKDIKPQNASTLKGVGDDSAVDCAEQAGNGRSILWEATLLLHAQG